MLKTLLAYARLAVSMVKGMRAELAAARFMPRSEFPKPQPLDVHRAHLVAAIQRGEAELERIEEQGMYSPTEVNRYHALMFKQERRRGWLAVVDAKLYHRATKGLN